MRHTILALTLLLAGSASVLAQSAAKPSNADSLAQEAASFKNCPDCAARRRDVDSMVNRTFYLKYAVQPADMNEIVGTVRQLLPQNDSAFLVPSAAAILVRAIPEDMTLAQKVIDDLDRPKKIWRLTYTLTEMDGDKRLGTQHYSMVVASGQQTVLKQGDRVPIVTGLPMDPKPGVSSQITYQDVGMTFDATLNEVSGGARLRSDVAQTSLADEKSGSAQQDPVLRQTELKSEAILAPGKPLVLGAMDMPGSTHHFQIEVLIEPLP